MLHEVKVKLIYFFKGKYFERSDAAMLAVFLSLIEHLSL